jgi:energy-coupling factor transporter ATP-binding protein EcfA2
MIGQNVSELVATPDVDRPLVCGSWFTESNICLLYGLRGGGKSTLAMGIALAIANEAEFLLPSWMPSKKYRTLYFDSEMGAESLKRKIRQVDSASSVSIQNTPLRLITPSDMGGTAWNLSDLKHQKTVSEMMEHHDVLIIDNLLGFSGPLYKGDDDTRVWKRLQDWLIPLRDAGKSILILHHTSKSGDQYGTITKENACDTVVKLEPVKDRAVNGISINLHFTKGRWIYGDDAKSLRVTYEKIESGQKWTCRSLDDANKEAASKMLKLGFKKKDIAEILKTSPSELEIMLKGSELVSYTTIQSERYDEFDVL